MVRVVGSCSAGSFLALIAVTCLLNKVEVCAFKNPWKCVTESGSGVLVQLVVELVRMTGSTDHVVSAAAATCLSEIGPVNLCVTALTGQNAQKKRAALDIKYHQ